MLYFRQKLFNKRGEFKRKRIQAIAFDIIKIKYWLLVNRLFVANVKNNVDIKNCWEKNNLRHEKNIVYLHKILS